MDKVLIDATSVGSDDPFAVPDVAYDFRIAGLHFNAGTTGDNPIERAFARVSKEMINASPQPGDASLDGWWIRSATDWSSGAGYEYMEPIESDTIASSYDWSYGVDVWEQGVLRLLPKPFKTYSGRIPQSGAKPQLIDYRDYIYVSNDDWIVRLDAKAFQSPKPVIQPPFPGYWIKAPSNIIQFCSGQGYLLVSTEKNGVFAVLSDGTLKQVWTSSLGPIRMYYMKDRFVLFSGTSVYFKAITDIYTPTELTQPFYTSPDKNFQWVGAATSPTSILLAGNGDDYSAIYSAGLEASDGVPTVGTPTVIAEMPRGEQITQVFSYLGALLLIATTSGIRLGVIGDTGTITYGPLLGCGLAKGPFTTFDRFAFVPTADAGGGHPGLIRFDLSKITEDQKVAWSYDLRIQKDTVPINNFVESVWDCVIPYNQVMILLSQNSRGVYLWSVQPGCDTEDYGVLQSGQIRMGSTVPKNWARFSISTLPEMVGGVRCEIVTPSGVHKIGDVRNPDIEKEWSFASEGLHSPHAAIRLTLARGQFPDIPPDPPPPPIPPGPEPPPIPPDPPIPPGPGDKTWNDVLGNSQDRMTWGRLKDSGVRWKDLVPSKPLTVVSDQSEPVIYTSPVVDGWALRGQPAIPRTELIRVGLLCFDYEVSNQGMKVGADAQAALRYQELRNRLAKNSVVEFVDLNNKHTESVSVDEMSYRQTAAPSLGSGFGGVIDLVLRVL